MIAKKDPHSIHPNEDALIQEMMDLCFQINSGKTIQWKNAALKSGVVLDVTKDKIFASYDQWLSDPNPSAGLTTIRGYTEIEHITPQIFYDWNEGFQDSHVTFEKEFEKTCTESKAVQYLDIDHTVAYTAYNPSSFISPRDFCYVRTRRFFKNVKAKDVTYGEVACGFYYDIEPKSKYFVKAANKHVRAYSVGGYAFCQKTPSDPIIMLFVSRLNLAGWIPQWLINLSIGSKADGINVLKKNMKITVDRFLEKTKSKKSIEEKQKKTGKDESDECKADE